ncbi:hypothetical protein GCM10020000_70570 [Streptomyces olivoverticillatus]
MASHIPDGVPGTVGFGSGSSSKGRLRSSAKRAHNSRAENGSGSATCAIAF